jgi:hypothetical protein
MRFAAGASIVTITSNIVVLHCLKAFAAHDTNAAQGFGRSDRPMGSNAAFGTVTPEQEGGDKSGQNNSQKNATLAEARLLWQVCRTLPDSWDH